MKGMKTMEATTLKIGNSVGVVFPKEIAPVSGKTYTILQVGEIYILKPKKENIFEDKKAWAGFRESITQEDKEWEFMNTKGSEI